MSLACSIVAAAKEATGRGGCRAEIKKDEEMMKPKEGLRGCFKRRR